MSKFAAVLKNRTQEPVEIPEILPVVSAEAPRRVGRPRGKRSNDENTQVTGYVPAQLYYDVRIKLMERKRRDRRAKTDFSDLLREWMEHWLAEQP